jgi:hypothetical protein
MKTKNEYVLFNLGNAIRSLEREVMELGLLGGSGSFSEWKRKVLEEKRERLVGLRAVRDHLEREKNEIVIP